MKKYQPKQKPIKMKPNITLANLTLSLLAGALSLTGCAHYNAMQGFPNPGYDVKKQIASLTATVNVVSTNLDSIKTTDERNIYIDKRVNLVDLEYVQYLKFITGFKNGVDAGSKVVTGTLGAVGAIVGGGTAQAVSAATAATSATSGAIDVTYFYNQTMPAMISAMNAARKDKLAAITLGKLKPLTGATNYSVYEAASDLNDYYFDGTLAGAAVAIQNNSSTTSTKAAQKIATAPVAQSADTKASTGKVSEMTPLERQSFMLRHPDVDLK
jgi:hypothetical protein